MLVSQSDTFGVPATVNTIVTIREVNSYNRVLYLKNLTVNAITIQIQRSADGGNTWDDVGSAISLGAAGGGADVEFVNVSDGNILRVRGSGGGNDRDLYLTYTRFYLDSDRVWTTPLL